MKAILIIIICLVAEQVTGQSIFQTKFYPADLILEHSKKINLTDDQEEQVQKIYFDNNQEFTKKKWELNRKMAELDEVVSPAKVDLNDATGLMNEILKLENDIKLLRFQTLIALKNTLTEKQQRLLNPYLENDQTGEINIGIDRQMVLKYKDKGIETDNEPLFYVISRGEKQKLSRADIAMIEPDNIKSIEVIKGESAIKLYGKEAKNGVIVIELKR